MTNKESKNVIVYQSEDGEVSFDVKLDLDTVWLSQAQIAELLDTTIPNANQHIKAIFEEGELKNTSTIKNFLIVQQEGNRQIQRNIEHYNLDVIISIGYRVKSKRGTQFRIWATQVLREHILKGYSINQKNYTEPNALIKADTININLYMDKVGRDIVNIKNSEIPEGLKEKLDDVLEKLKELANDKNVKEISSQLENSQSPVYELLSIAGDCANAIPAIFKLLSSFSP